MSEDKRFTEDELEVLLECWAVHARGASVEPKPEALPTFHRLASRGWLEHSFHDDAMTYKWTKAAELALDISNLTEAAKASVN